MTGTDSNAHQGNGVAEPQGEQDNRSAIEMQAETAAGDLRDYVIDTHRPMAKPWVELSEHEQRRMVDRISADTRNLVRRLVKLIAIHEFESFDVEIASLAVKPGKGLQVTLTVPVSESTDLASLAALAQSGARATLVRADAREFLEARAEVKIDLDQPDLPIGEEAQAEEGNGAEKLAGLNPDVEGAAAAARPSRRQRRRSEGERIADEVRADAEQHVRGEEGAEGEPLPEGPVGQTHTGAAAAPVT